MNSVAPSPLTDKADVVRGVTFSKGDAVAEPREGYTPVLRAGNIQGHLILDSDLVYIPEQLVSEKQRLRRGDIVMCTSSGSAEIVGKTAFADQDWSGSFGAFCAVVRPKPGKCNARYLLHYLRTPKFRDWTRNSSGIGIKNIRKSELDSYEIPFPSIDEQRRIAAILDKADTIRRKREQALALADNFLKSVFLEMFGDPVLNPRGFRMLPFSEILTGIDSGHSPRCEARPAAPGEYGVLKVSAVSSTVFKAGENKAVLDGYSPNERHLIKTGDLLFSRKNTYELVGAAALVESEVKNLAMPDLIFRLVTHPKRVTKEFLWAMLVHSSMRAQLRSFASGAAASMPNIGKGRLLELCVPVPDLPLQEQFGECYRRTRALHSNVSQHQKDAGWLFDTLSQRAFCGEL